MDGIDSAISGGFTEVTGLEATMEAKAIKEEGPSEEYKNAPGDEFGPNGAKLQPSNPQVEPSKGGGKVDNDTMQVASRLKGDLMKDFDFRQQPRRPILLPVHPT